MRPACPCPHHRWPTSPRPRKLGLRIWNTGADLQRNLYINDSLVHLLATYDKSEAIRGTLRVVYRRPRCTRRAIRGNIDDTVDEYAQAETSYDRLPYDHHRVRIAVRKCPRRYDDINYRPAGVPYDRCSAFSLRARKRSSSSSNRDRKAVYNQPLKTKLL